MATHISQERKALALAASVVALWATWSDSNEDVQDDALRLAFEAADVLDFTQIDGVIASPLKYFARAYLNEENPEDLTFQEMADSLSVSIKILRP
jgi:hypothetical protein